MADATIPPKKKRHSPLRRVTLELQDRIVAEFMAGETSAALGKRYGLCGSYAKCTATKRGLRANRPRRYTLRLDAFSEGTRDDHYWIGMMMSDGWITGGYLALELADVDRGHVEKFRAFLGASNPIKVTDNSAGSFKATPSHRLIVGSTALVAVLADYGVVPRKSRNAAVTGLAHSADFWRGVVDGDGSVGFVNQGGRPAPYITLVGSAALVGQFRDFVLTILPGLKIKTRMQKPTLATLLIRGPQAIPVVKALYADATVSLDRKAEKARQIIALTS